MKLQCPTPAQIQTIYNELASQEEGLKSYPTTRVQERFKIYTHRKTITALKKCFKLLSELTGDETSTISEILKQIETVLKERWEHIRGSFLCYTQAPKENLNTLCLDIAKALYPLPAIIPTTQTTIETVTETAIIIAMQTTLKATDEPASETTIKTTIEEATKSMTDEVTKVAIAAAINSAMKRSPNTPIPIITERAKIAAKDDMKAFTEVERAIDTRLPFREGPYFLLMPSLEADKDAANTNIHNFKLHEFVLSDRQDLFIPVAICLEMARFSEKCVFTHQVAKPADLQPQKNAEGRIINPDPYRCRLSSSEINRVAYHSEASEQYFRAIKNLHEERQTNSSLGAALKLLVTDLRNGGAHANGNGKGEEFNSGSSANEGIIKFAKKWNNYTEDQKKALYEKYRGGVATIPTRNAGKIAEPSLQELIERVIRSEKFDPTQVQFCVELTADDLNTFIGNYENQLKAEPCTAKVVASDLQAFIDSAEKAHEPFKQAIAAPDYSVKPVKSLGRLPALLLSESNDERQKILGNKYPNFFIYGLLEPEVMDTEFLLDTFKKLPANVQKELVNVQINKYDSHRRQPYHYTALIEATRNRNSVFVRAIIDAGADINAGDTNNDTALNWAAHHGHLEIMRLLLDNNADLTIRGHGGLNPFETALKPDSTRDPGTIPELCIKIFNSSPKIQATILKNVPGNYTNIATWAFNHHPATLSALHTLPNSDLVAQLTMIYHNQSLIQTISKGHQVPIIEALLTANPGIKTTTEAATANTPLMVAVIHKNKAAFELLLAQNPDLTTRNKNGENVLDLIIKHAPEFLPQLSLKIFNSSPATLKELFAKLSDDFARQCSKDYEITEWAFENRQADTLSALIASHKAAVIAKLKEIYEKQTLIKAVAKGHKAPLIQALITDAGLNINERDPQQDTALTLAATHANAPAMQILLEHNADMTLRNSKKDNVLDIIIKKESKILLKALCIKIGSKPEAEQKQILEKQGQGRYNHIFCWAFDNNPLITLAFLTHPEVKEAEMAAKIKALHKNSALIFAVEKGYLPLIPYLGTEDIINFRNDDTAITRAASLKNREAVTLLLAQKPDISITNSKGENAIDIALKNDLSLLPLLLAYIAPFPVEQRKKILAKYSLHQAIMSEANGLVQALLDINVDINAPDLNSNTPLMQAVIQKSPGRIALLLAKNPDLTHSNKEGKNVLNLTLELIKKPDLILQLLLKIAEQCPLPAQKEMLYRINKGRYNSIIDFVREEYPKDLPAILALPNIQLIVKNAANLITAVKNGAINAVQNILTGYSNIDSQDAESDTALMCATRQNNLELTQLLLGYNPDLTLRNKAGDNALDIAIKNAQKLIPNLLNHSANTLDQAKQQQLLQNIEEGRYKTILSYARARHPQQVAHLLSLPNVEQGVKVASQALLHAVQASLELVKDCIAKDADINTQDFCKDTPLSWAIYAKKLEIARFLLNLNPDLTVRNTHSHEGGILTIALRNLPEFVPELLLKIATRPLEEQLLFLLPEKKYKHIYGYIGDLYPKIIPDFFALPNIKSMAASEKLIMLAQSDALLKAAKNGPIELVQTLVTQGADINIQDQQGNTPLTLAVLKGNETITQFLLTQKADTTIRNHKGENIFTLSPILQAKNFTDDLVAAKRYLNNLGFDNRIVVMKEKIAEMSSKIRVAGKRSYDCAKGEMESLVQTLEAAKIAFLRNNNRPGLLMNASNVSQFKTTCIQAIKKSRPILKQHREWLGIITNFLWTIMTLGANRHWDFFALKTDSQKKLDALEARFERLDVSGPAA